MGRRAMRFIDLLPEHPELLDGQQIQLGDPG